MKVRFYSNKMGGRKGFSHAEEELIAIESFGVVLTQVLATMKGVLGGGGKMFYPVSGGRK